MPQLEQWSTWVQMRLQPEFEHGNARSQSENLCFRELPHWIQNLSVDAAFHMLHALGVRELQFARVATADVLKPPAAAVVRQILSRGLTRAKTIEGFDAAGLRMLNGLLYEQGVERLASRSTNPADQAFSRTLLEQFNRVNRQVRNTGRKRAHHQEDLFMDAPLSNNA
ncbi:hypothetical protein LNV08_15605 [Paucibacter sp. TC2R-5]|uniref:hypothetical protein n=1 Tax=Paucibacter sp. TC2R-5 TaxID=2893555 RepID=UPI0021E4458D|nr:hypothetical protein [Paucibacter sp. TC2R-5]MCV2360402.1 hypothetical protein [Paucibacter sp. TC2R-5]